METEPNLLELPLVSTGLTQIDNESVRSIANFLQDRLPESDKSTIDDGLNWNYVLEKHRTDKSKCKKSDRKKKYLTRKEKKSLELTKLPKENWDYSKLLKMNNMWSSYMMSMLNNPKKIPKPEESDYQNFCAVLNKAELVGSEITVIRSNVPTYVGITGIVVLETKFTIQLVTKDSKLKILLKQHCVFRMKLNTWKFTMFGKHFLTRSSDRSAKKIKYYSLTDL